MNLTEAQALAQRHLLNNNGARSLLLVRGQGCRVWDAAGREYLDCLGGIAVNGLGHAHPAVARAVAQQAATLIHVSNLYLNEPQLTLAEKLSVLAGGAGARSFFCNSGAEANETAFKLARKFGKTRPGTPYAIISAQHSFHGRTLATVAATAQEKYQKPFAPMPAGFNYAPYNDLAALRAAVTDQTVAVLLEVLQGEGGVTPGTTEFLQGARQLCDERGLLLIFDEVQTGVGRLGEWFGWQTVGVRPDLFTLAKGLGGGVPIGATVVLNPAVDFAPGDHNSTFGGNPLACAAALATLTTIEQENLLAAVRERGTELQAGLAALAARHPAKITGTRGRGLLQGLILAAPGAALVTTMQERGFIINCTAGNVLRFAPPYIITSVEIQRLLTALDEAVAGWQPQP
ncbi:MAG TPA: acetylornithine transaminase [bacterium]|nr:acetylornithine transaminase [bacterium]